MRVLNFNSVLFSFSLFWHLTWYRAGLGGREGEFSCSFFILLLRVRVVYGKRSSMILFNWLALE